MRYLKLSRYLFLAVFIYTIGVLGILKTAPHAGASSLANWKAGRVIDDSVFTNNLSMSPSAIQAFLNSKVPVCDTSGTQPSEYGGGTRAQWGQANYGQSTFTCLRDYQEGGKSAAQIIYDKAQEFRINPQVLIVLLQKEQALVTDTWPLNVQYRTATGYGCPDTAPCDTEYYGFTNQVTWAARMFRAIMDASPTWYTPYVLGNNFIRYNPNSSCGGSQVTIENRATQALYNYTPYQPNQAALDAGYGTAPCGAYGNRNFYLYFTDWFGATTGPNYAWAIESFTYSGGDNIIAPGQTETLTLKARNIGRFPWYNHGGNPVRLGTWEPAGRVSSLFNASKLATVQESVVLPNEVGTFVFTVTPSTIGTFSESLNLVAENSEWAGWPGFRPTIIVPKSYQWDVQSVIYEKGTGMMDPGDKQLITLIAKNSGSATWSKSSGPTIRVGTWQPQRQSAVGQGWISSTRAVEMNEVTVAPGQNAGFQFYVRMPSSGQYYEHLNLVAEGQAWFNDPGLTLYLFGNDYSWKLESVNYSNGTGVMAPGSTQTITVKARNTGTATWHNDGSFPVKLGTWQPQRQSQVSSTWSSSTRMASLSESSVAPGGVGTFTATILMPSTGTFYEQMNLVSEGLKWFNNPGLTFYLEGKNP